MIWGPYGDQSETPAPPFVYFAGKTPHTYFGLGGYWHDPIAGHRARSFMYPRPGKIMEMRQLALMHGSNQMSTTLFNAFLAVALVAVLSTRSPPALAQHVFHPIGSYWACRQCDPLPCFRENEGIVSCQGPPRQVKPPPTAVTRVFHYYYINGINTPYGDGTGRGTYVWERSLVARQLVDNIRLVDPASAGETDKMAIETHNMSGADEISEPLFKLPCVFNSALGYAYIAPCQRIINCARGNMSLLSGTPGDLIESFRQSLKSSVFTQSGTDFAANYPLVMTIAQNMSAIEQSSQKRTPYIRHYFIVVAHSQGNFFAEGLARRLAQSYPELVPRTGILSLASPTDYSDVAATGVKIMTLTRKDDVILNLNNLQAGPVGLFFKAAKITGKKTAPANLPAFDPKNLTNANALKFNPQQRLSDTENAYAQCLEHRDLSFDNNNGVFVVPQINSHVIDSYLLDPVPAPGTNAVLTSVLNRLASLKRALREQ